LLDETRNRLYVVTRFDNSLVTVDLGARNVIGRARMHTPEPAAIIQGRPMLYDARFTSTNGEASCGSCHVFGDFDSLAWDLGNPDGDTLPNPNPIGPIGMATPFHPMKGPMTTQSFRGMADEGPLHWRGDRSGGNATPAADPMDENAGFLQFSGAFEGLLGREEGALRAEEMQRFADFALSIYYPPNPIRQLDNTLRPDEQRGSDIYFTRDGIDTVTTCNGCHTMDRGLGAYGSGGEMTFEAETQQFKVAHLRNAYQKVGMFGMAEAPFFNPGDNGARGPQVRGFGYLHDGSTDTLFRFLHAGVFNFSRDAERRDVSAFVMAFDSNLPPIVGQQVTVDSTLNAAAIARAQLMGARALTPMVITGGSSTTECDLIAHGLRGGQMRGWLLQNDGLFHSDRASEAPLSAAEMQALAMDGPLTFTCVAPGSGRRLALDRDEDGTLDRDELDSGSDPAARTFIEIPNPTLPMRPPPPMPDGGMPDPDAGTMEDAGQVAMTDAGVRVDAGTTTTPGGCGCRTVPASRGPWAIAALIAIVSLRRRRR
jgi:MYXO-CTERM domain-containing protein